MVPDGKYTKKILHFNKKNLLTVFVCGEINKDTLSQIYQKVDSAANIIGTMFPKHLKKIVSYGKRNYSLTIVVNKKTVTGLEHFNSPYIVAMPKYINTSNILHTLLHSFIGKSLIPHEYMEPDGKFKPSDALGFYEGLTTFLSMKYEKNFPMMISSYIYRAKINVACSDITKVSVCGKELEKWYPNGYLFWFYLESIGLDVEKFTYWVYEKEFLHSPLPNKIHFTDVLKLLSKYNKNIGRVARKIYKGEYVSLAFDILKANGWSPIPVWEIPRWYDTYIGPYPIDKSGISLPNDIYPPMKSPPKFLLRDGKKMPLKAENNNIALKLIKSNPDSIFKIEFEDGQVLFVENKLKFPDGSPYFMHGIINVNKFWKKFNIYFR